MKLREIKLTPPIVAISAMLVVMVFANGAFATDYTWVGGSSMALDDKDNWSGGIVPGDGDKGTITVSGDEPVTFTVETDTFAPWKLVFKPATGATAPVCVDLCKHTISMPGTSSARGRLVVQVPSFTVKNGIWKGDQWIVEWGASDRITTFEFTIEDATFDPPWGNWGWCNVAYAGGVLKLKNAKSNYVPYFQENLTLLCDNSTFKGMVPHNPAYGTNFFWHVTNHSVITNGTSGGDAQNAHVVIDGESTVDIDGNLVIGSKNGKAHDNILAISNATVKVNYITVAGTNDVSYFHNVDFISRATWHPMSLNGVSNKVYFTGAKAMSNRRVTNLGRGTLFSVGEGTTLTNGEIHMENSSGCVSPVAPNAFFWTSGIYSRSSATDADASSGNVYEIMHGATALFAAMENTRGVNGQSNVWRIAGQLLTNNGLDLGMYATSNGNRVELLGDDARFLCGRSVGGGTGHLTIGNATNPDSITVLFKPGPNGFGGEPPLTSEGYSFGRVTIHKANFEVDLREYHAVLPARKAVYRIPLIKTGIYSSKVAVDDLEELNAKAKILPDGGRLVVDGRVLYCEFYKKPGLLILVR